MQLQLLPFEPVSVLNFQFVLTKSTLWLQATCSARVAIGIDGHKDSVGHTSH